MQAIRNVPLALLILAGPIHVLGDENDDRESLRAELELVREAGILGGREVEIAAADLISEFYANRNFAPAWMDVEKVGELVGAIEATAAEGFDPEDYLLDEVRSVYGEFLAGFADPQARSTADILLTEVVIRMGYHQLFGKVNPTTLNADWNFRRDLDGRDPAAMVEEIIESRSPAESLMSLVPRGWLYSGLKRALAEYRRIEANGGWPGIPDGPTLRPGTADDRLTVLAERLAITGDLEAAGAFDTYDATLEAGVRRFQRRHALEVDGVIGPATMAALNAPVAARIGQIELSLERARWVMKGLEDDFVIVNIAGFEVYLVRDREVVWQTRAMVGRNYRQSPIFRDEIKYLVFNPTWTVPYNIATSDLLPQILADAGYLAERGFSIRDRQGDLVDAGSIDWTGLRRGNFPYTLVQEPGPENALGRVKFMFPNEHDVYLHDTPNRALFDSPDRAFSSGCIRVENPFGLAEQLLGRGWDRQRIDEVIASGETTTVRMREPMPVLLLYWTADVTPDGVVRFFADVYGRDPDLARALDQPFSIDPPGG
jgi:murein L,D-transpeptidase YcbB/YkuD